MIYYNEYRNQEMAACFVGAAGRRLLRGMRLWRELMRKPGRSRPSMLRSYKGTGKM